MPSAAEQDSTEPVDATQTEEAADIVLPNRAERRNSGKPKKVNSNFTAHGQSSVMGSRRNFANRRSG